MMKFNVSFKEITHRLPVTFQVVNKSILVNFQKLDKKLSVEFSRYHTLSIREDVEYYEGEYDVTPTVDAQSIPTAKKFMKDDVTVKEIPYFVTGNNSGGDTAYIGKEIQ